jgi:hypothetical protein
VLPTSVIFTECFEENFLPNGVSLPNSAHKSVSFLYQFFVLTGVPSGKLLGFIISHRGIEANPEKISAITKMKALTCIKDVQKLTGCMAALNRFISKLGERGMPFFKLLKHQEKFVWTPEAYQALTQLKDFLSKPPVVGAEYGPDTDQ